MDAANFRFNHDLGSVFGYISEKGLRLLQLSSKEKPLRPHLLHSAPNIIRGRVLHQAFDRYFCGIPEAFDAIPLDYTGASAFQKEVWETARTFSYGQTGSYADLARAMGRNAGSARAVGNALAKNPIHILVPCHRFVPASGGIGNYAAAKAWKKHLLQLESGKK